MRRKQQAIENFKLVVNTSLRQKSFHSDVAIFCSMSSFFLAYDAQNRPPVLEDGSVLVIGNFDGVHKGHQKLLSEARDVACSKNLPLVVMTFEPHPKAFFAKDDNVFRLTTPSQKSKYLKKAGADGVLFETFNKSYAAMPASQFMERLFATLKAKDVFVGENFRFGYKREGALADLKRFAANAGQHVHGVAVLRDENHNVISSSLIREHLQQGYVNKAASHLGRPFEIEGVVVKGHQLGRELGFPTANIRPPSGCALRYGIYAVSVVSNVQSLSKPTSAIASFGIRPTVNEGEPLLEVHIPRFHSDLYGRQLNVAFQHWIRAEQKFDTLDALTAQMHKDLSCIECNQE